MENYKPDRNEKDPALWDIARKRAAFKTSLITYLIVNLFLWVLWYFTAGRHYHGGIPWPVWPSLGWGVGLLFQYFGAYVYPEANSAEREYEKLKNRGR